MPLAPLPLDRAALKSRQGRLVAEVTRRKCGLAVLTRPESIQWLTGARVAPTFTPTAAIDDAGCVTLVLPDRAIETPAVADRVVPYVERRLSTMRDASEQRVSSIEALLDTVADAPSRAACEFSVAPRQLTTALAGDWIDLDPILFQLRRRKDADELAILAHANEANRAMYEAARRLVAPGLNELDLYSELQAVAVRTLGEPLTYFGQDFRAGARGGSPRDRQAQAGELWVLDLGVGYRGYYSDNCRTLAVSEPTAAQQTAWERVAEVFPLVEATVRPGASCKALFEEVSRLLAGSAPWVFNHHLGHGVGLAPHEAPRLNPNWDDTFEVGDFFTAEPGLYHESLQLGVRLEQNYVVTEGGVQLLTDWPLGL
ncbi:MAG: M24 family metallopeptidase [Lacipirellulaceae bacterium]